MDINFELYKVFYYVAKSLSFSEASGQLHISQSAVSQSIKLLEQKMNCRLFVRNTKQVKLTQEGETLFQHIEQAFNFIRAGERSIEEIHSLQQGEVRIGASDTICKYYLLPYFKQFHTLFPGIRIKVTNRTSPRCIELLKKGSVDLAVVNVPETVDRSLQVRELKTIEDIFIAGKNFDPGSHLKQGAWQNLQDVEISLRDLKDLPLLMLEKNTTTRLFFDSFLEKQGVKVKPEVELGSVDLLIEMAKIGLGVSLVVRDYVRQELANGEVFEVKTKEKLPARQLGLMTNKAIPVPAAALRFLDLLV